MCRASPSPATCHTWAGSCSRRAGACVVYVDAEAVPQLLNQRALQWQMDSSRLFLLLPQPGEMIDFGQARDQDRLVEMVSALSPDLVIIDSLSSISTKGENNVEDVRLVLGYLNLLAQDFDIGLVLIHHLRKGSSLQARLWDVSIDDFRGSGHIIAMSRSVMGLSVVQAQAEPDRNGPRKLEIIKTNLGAYPSPLGFEFAPLQPAGVFLKWGSAPQPYQEPTQLEKCKAWLESLLRLSTEPLKPRQVIEQGEEEGYGRSLIYRAREELANSIQNTHGRQHPHNAWQWVASSDPDVEEEP